MPQKKSTGLGVRRRRCYYRFFHFLTVRTLSNLGLTFLIHNLEMIAPPGQRKGGDHRSENALPSKMCDSQ